VDTGRVISTSPPENSQLEKGSTVVLVVSSGPEQVTVPGVVGRQEDDARSTLENAGLRADITREESSGKDPGTVLRQDPGGGGKVDKGSAVKLVVAKAPPDVAVPDVVDEKRADAEKALKDAGFDVRVRMQDVDTVDQDGIVIDQDPAGGDRLSKGSRVTIMVGRFKPPVNAEPSPSATPSPTVTPGSTP